MNLIGVVEETATIPETMTLMRSLGYKGNLFFFPSRVSNPDPDGYTFLDMAETLYAMGVIRLVVGGQNSWVVTEKNVHINKQGPFRFKATEKGIPTHVEYLAGCVGHFIREISDRLSFVSQSEGKVGLSVQLSSLAWPQRRGTDKRIEMFQSPKVYHP
jgi:hypothetical protein